MLTKPFVLLCLLCNFSKANDRLPPTEGKYFYADLRSGSQYGVQFLDMQMGHGDEKRKMNVFVTSSYTDIGIITTECSNPWKCDVPAPF